MGDTTRTLKARLEADGSGLNTGLKNTASGVDKITESLKKLRENSTLKLSGLDNLKQSLKGLSDTIQPVADKLKSIGKATFGAMVAGAAAAGETAQRLDVMSEALGTSIGQTQAVEKIVGKAGMSLDRFGAVASTITSKLQEAREGSKTAGEAFAKLGINVNDTALKAKSPIELFSLVQTKLKGIANEQERIALAKDLGMGARATKLLGLDLSTEAIDKRAKGPDILNEEQSKALLEMRGAYKTLGNEIAGAWQKIYAAAAPTITWFVQGITSIVQGITGWADRNQWLIKAMAPFIVAIGVVAGALGTALGTIGPFALAISNIAVSLGGGAVGAAGLSSGLIAMAPAAATAATALAVVATSVVALIAVWKDLKAIIDAVKGALGSFGKNRQMAGDLVDMGASEADAQAVREGRMSYGDAMNNAALRGTAKSTVTGKSMQARAGSTIVEAEQQSWGDWAGDKAKSMGLRAMGPVGYIADELRKRVPKMAAGGLVSHPTMAIVGEAGPEAVIPLDRLRMLQQSMAMANGGAAMGRTLEILIAMLARGGQGGASLQQTFHVSGVDTELFRKSAAAEGRRMAYNLGMAHSG